MKPEVTLKYLSYLQNKKQKGEGGFTLIELLVVVIIIGVLAAVALPNLLGQVGKARETEGKNGVGTVNRAQQAYHFEKGTFSDALTGPSVGGGTLQANNALGVIVSASKYYNFDIPAGNNTFATITAIGVAADGTTEDSGAAQGTRDFVGGIDFDGSGVYDQVICQANVSGTGTVSVLAVGSLACTGTDTELE